MSLAVVAGCSVACAAGACCVWVEPVLPLLLLSATEAIALIKPINILKPMKTQMAMNIFLPQPDFCSCGTKTGILAGEGAFVGVRRCPQWWQQFCCSLISLPHLEQNMVVIMVRVDRFRS